MKKLLGVLAAVAVTLTLAAAPATAATNTFRARTTGITVLSLVGDPAVVAARCPAGFAERGALLLTVTGTLQVESDVYSGPMTIADTHCSVPRPPMFTWINGTRTVTPIELEAGAMTLTAPSGELFLSYRAPGVIKGDLFGVNTHTFNGPYTITGGTGIFDGASGNGHVGGAVLGTATGFTGGWEANGTLRVSN